MAIVGSAKQALKENSKYGKICHNMGAMHDFCQNIIFF